MSSMKGTIPEITRGIEPKRETGMAGMGAIEFEMKRANLLDLLDWVAEIGKVTKHQKETLTNMINSPDRENFVLAEEMIKTKQEI